jgi:CHAT domain-containing protein/tetratricopeptide (TPR) repeat protein
MNKAISGIIFVFSFSWNLIYTQDKDTYDLFLRFNEYYNSGDFINAEESMLSVLNSEKKPPEVYIVAAYNNLGVINNCLGKYKEALECYNLAEAHISNKVQDPRSLADIYINKARIYTFQESFNTGLEYLDKGIRIYLSISNPDIDIFQRISTSYLNTGIIHYTIKDYKTALGFFIKSSELKTEKDLPEKALPYLNIAKTYKETNNPIKAEEFYIKSIRSFKAEFGEEYYRLAEAYFDYGLFLKSVGQNKESLEALQKALLICLKNYGEKHSLVSFSYKLIGDHYVNQNDYDSALFYYQKSLIAVVKNFNDPDIFSNPSVDSSLFDIRLLDNLKSKAHALELLAGRQDDPDMKMKITGKSLETIELALRLVDIIRNNYPSEESRIYLAENEKETYISAVHIAIESYFLSNGNPPVRTIYNIAQRAKAAILRNEITGNELMYSAGMPDSLRETRNRLTVNIAAYNNLILEESRSTNPDSSKIILWKDALFNMNREKEKVADEIGIAFPRYYELIRKTEPVPPEIIQKQLKKDETIIDYLLSNQYSDGKRKLYVFLIKRDHIEFRETGLDSLFLKNAEILRNTSNTELAAVIHRNNFADYSGALNYMYVNLIKPFEELFSGNKLIIIPDEEIGWLPFDAFLKSKPAADQSDFEGLHYLIRDYTISYGYSSSLIFSTRTSLKKGLEVFSFSPDYGNTSLSDRIPDSLNGAVKEIESIYKWFRGKKFTGDKSTKTNFILAMRHPAIFHLAMHSMSDSLNSRYSYILFDTHNGPAEEGKMYNYEIGLSRLKSPMVVLSACNSGTGTLYSGEGLMSLARGFMLAGTSSVIKTAWEVNDESSSAVITRFYYHLSEGKQKNEALRLAKLEYLEGAQPVYADPYYWAGYEVLGDNAPVARGYTRTYLTVIILIVALAGGGLAIYFRRRRIFSDRSR